MPELQLGERHYGIVISGCTELTGFVAHEVSKLREVARQLSSRQTVGDGIFQRLLHAHQPLIAFRFANWKRQMARAQSRMAESFDVHWRPA